LAHHTFVVARPRYPPLFPYTTLFRSLRPKRTPRCGAANSFALQLDDLDAGSNRVKAQHSPESSAVLQKDIPAIGGAVRVKSNARSEEHTSELQSLAYLVCRLLFENKI